MKEKHLIQNWNQLRSNIIQAQLASVIILSVVVFLVVNGEFSGASDEVKLFTLAVLAATGILSLVSQFAAIREAEAITRDLKKSDSLTGRLISVSAPFLKLTRFVMALFGIGIFALLVLAIY